ncbi:MAG: hypothetical protein NWE98_01625 [Candidatus Bathyarchaeota archaeon]|nr:hypothetical protein [Candidatus Bathyarchaeota archaeon]
MTEHLEQHLNQLRTQWRFVFIGSLVGFSAIMIRIIYLVFTNQLPQTIGADIVEIVLSAIPLIVFLFFLHVAIVEYEDIREEIKRLHEELGKEMVHAN